MLTSSSFVLPPRTARNRPAGGPAQLRHLGIVLLALAAIALWPRISVASAAPASVRRYTVRGEVVKLPDAAAKPPQLFLRHEAIPDFVDSSGRTVGMAAMVMPFDLAPGVALDAVRPGDKVEVTLAVDWTRPSLVIERLRKLPDDTALDLGAKGHGGAKEHHPKR